jgi:hypothetical protein
VVLGELHNLVLDKVQIHVVCKYGTENLRQTKCDKLPCLPELASERDD